MAASIALRRRVGDYLRLARISNSPTVVSNTLAGAALAGAGFDWRVAALALGFVLFYTAGMVLNDVCDLAIDRRERPERPLPSGRVGRGEAILLTVALFAAGFALLLVGGGAPALAWGALLGGAIAAYDLWHKTNPLSPLLMAATRAMVYAAALAGLAGPFDRRALTAIGLLFLYVVGLTFIAKCELRPSFGAIWPAVCVLLPGVLPMLWFAPAAIPIGAALLGWAGYSLSFVYRSANRSIGGAIVRLIAGIALYDALVCAICGGMPGAGAAILAFGATLFLQRYIRGT